MKYLYKYKSGEDRDIEALRKGQLWVSTYSELNDPTDFPVFAQGIGEEKIDEYCERFEKLHCCMSFSTTPNSKRLWNYYTNGMRGIIISYDIKEIRNALKEAGITNYFEGSVVYDGKKIDVTDCISNPTSLIPEKDAFFHKTEDWKEEKEYRFVFDYDSEKNYYLYENGFLLNNLKAHHVFIGYKMAKKRRKSLIEYCSANGVVLYEIKPNRKSRDIKDYTKRILVHKNGVVSSDSEKAYEIKLDD